MIDQKKLLEVRKKFPIFSDVSDYALDYVIQGFFDGETVPVKIPIDSLNQFSTSCGVEGNHPFDKKVISFLKENSALDFVVVELTRDENTINNMAIKWKRSPIRNSRKFGTMVNNNEGSLREECCIREGWDTFESE